MTATVTLRLLKGRLDRTEYVFDERTTCVLGRADDCAPRLPSDEYHRTVSRHHCLLDINPPDARIRDFGSLNGTFVNGKKIGQRNANQTPARRCPTRSTTCATAPRSGSATRSSGWKSGCRPGNARCRWPGAPNAARRLAVSSAVVRGSTSVPPARPIRAPWPSVWWTSHATGTEDSPRSPDTRCFASSAAEGWARCISPATSRPVKRWR